MVLQENVLYLPLYFCKLDNKKSENLQELSILPCVKGPKFQRIIFSC